MAAVFGRGVRDRSGAMAACLGGVCGMLLLLLVARQAPPASRFAALLESSRRRAVRIQGANDAVASRIRREHFGGSSTRAARQLQLAWHERERAVRAMLDEEEEEGDAGAEDDGGEETPADAADDNEYARFVWRKQRLQTDWGVNVDSWGGPDRAFGVGERQYTAGHHAADDIAEAANSTVGSGGDLSGHASGNASLSNGTDVSDDRSYAAHTHTHTHTHAHPTGGG